MSAFSEAIYSLRRKSGLTQAELAQAVGMSKSAISMYECGKREPEFDILEAFADYFHVSVNYLLGREESEPLVNDDPELTSYLEELRDRPEMRMLFSVTRGATREDVEAAVRIIEALRSRDDNT